MTFNLSVDREGFWQFNFDSNVFAFVDSGHRYVVFMVYPTVPLSIKSESGTG